MHVLSIAFSLFLLMDPIGNIPLYISFLKGLEPKRQRLIIFRELLIALVIIIIFNFIGEELMSFLNVQEDTIQIAGGVILFIISLKMIFPSAYETKEKIEQEGEPFIVPLAVPLVAGPSVLAAVIIYSRQTNDLEMICAIFIAWVGTLIILISSYFLKRVLGAKGILAFERLMGLVLILIAVQMFMSGVLSFVSKQAVIKTTVYSRE